MQRRRVRKAARRLHRLGIREVILPVQFPFSTIVEETGLRQVSGAPLAQVLGTRLVELGLEKAGICSCCVEIGVAAARLTGAVTRTVTELCLHYRYVSLFVPEGGEALAVRLRREYGVVLRLAPPGERAAAAVYFDPNLPGARPEVCLQLWEETLPAEVRLPPDLEDQLPAELDRNRLLSLLLQAGAISPGQLRVSQRETGMG